MTETLRSMVRETELSPNDFIYPMFVVTGKRIKKEISSMPGIYQLSIENAVKECAVVKSLGIPAVILFGIPEHKDEVGSGAYDENGIIQQAVRAIKKEVPELFVITDVCLCEYTSHGHCGIVRGNDIVNDESIELLAREALTHAQAGADMVAPSDMFDGRVKAIRQILDDNKFLQQSMPPAFTDHSARQPKARQNSAIANRIRWIRQTPMKRCAKCERTSRRERISSW
jgi:porphobilinogen synthase